MADIVDTSQADKLKDEGNAYLSQCKYSLAIAKYSEAITLKPNAIYYSNRAQAHIKMESYGLAIADANSAIAIDAGYIKAYYRRGSANFALGKTKLALKDFKAVCKLIPSDKDAMKKMQTCDKVVKAELFNAAIEFEIVQAPLLDFTTIDCSSSYDGPRIPEDGSISREFVLELMEHLKAQKVLHKRFIIQLLTKLYHEFFAMTSLMTISLPSEGIPENAAVTGISNDAELAKGDPNRRHITVCGDTHGQYYDLCNIFTIGGMPSATNPYLFNGDYVDRGSWSLEVVLTLFAWRAHDPTCMYLHRGNHETQNMNKMYGFEGEVMHKYDKNVMDLFTRVFNNLPLASVIQNTVFVTHGGIPAINNGCVPLKDINGLTRNRQPPESGLLHDLLWTDPQPELGFSPSKRGLGFAFGPDITANFLKTNNMSLVVRSHEVKDEGYVVEHDGKCITIFSAPNYCDQMKNQGAFIRFYEDMVPTFKKFGEVDHPKLPPMAYASGMMSQFGL